MEKNNKIKKIALENRIKIPNGGNGRPSNVGTTEWENKMKLYLKMKDFGK